MTKLNVEAIGYDGLIISGRRAKYPTKRKTIHRIVQRGSRVFVDGFEWTGAGWKITIRSILACLFG